MGLALYRLQSFVLNSIILFLIVLIGFTSNEIDKFSRFIPPGNMLFIGHALLSPYEDILEIIRSAFAGNSRYPQNNSDPLKKRFHVDKKRFSVQKPNKERPLAFFWIHFCVHKVSNVLLRVKMPLVTTSRDWGGRKEFPICFVRTK